MNNKAEAMIAEIKALSWWQRWFTDEKANIYKRFAEEAHAEILADTKTKLNKYLRKLDNGDQDQKKKAALLRGVRAHLEAHNLSLTFDNMLDYVSGRVIGLEQELGDVRTELEAANNKINQLEDDLEQIKNERDQAKLERDQAKLERDQAKLERDQAKQERVTMQNRLDEITEAMTSHGLFGGVSASREGESEVSNITGRDIPPSSQVEGESLRKVSERYFSSQKEGRSVN
jgi:chromosome segregation ATPase